MRTKVLLSLAAFAVSAFAAYAQSNVYSVNIVGYVNQVLPAGQNDMVHNPLDDGTNTLNSAFAALPNGSTANVWNGAGYSPASKAKGVWSPNLAVPTGTGLFIKSASAVTNTFVGEVIVGPGESATNSLPAGVSTLTGSLIPFAGALNDTNLGLTQLDNGSSLNQWNGAGYTPASKAKGVWSPNLSVGVAEGLFIKSVNAKDWVQTLPAN